MVARWDIFCGELGYCLQEKQGNKICLTVLFLYSNLSFRLKIREEARKWFAQLAREWVLNGSIGGARNAREREKFLIQL